MKLIALQENLLQAVSVAGKFLPSKTATLPAINNFFIQASTKEILLHATDLESSISLVVSGKVEKQGEVLLPAKPLISLLSLYKGEKITLEYDGKSVAVSSKSSKATLKVVQIGEFPIIEKNSSLTFTKMNKGEFEDILNRVLFAASTDQARAELTGLLFDGSGEKLTVVATDGFRLSRVRTGEENKAWSGRSIVPAKALKLLGELIKSSEGVEIAIDTKQNALLVNMDAGWFMTRLIQGDFPPYEKILPQSSSTTIEVNREEFSRAVRLASVFAREASNIVKITATEGVMSISANAPQTGENETTLSIKKTGEDIETAFNFRFLLDFLNACSEDEVVFESNGPLQPGAFSAKNNSQFLHVIMPVRLQESS